MALVALLLIGGQRAGLAGRFAKLRVAADDMLLPPPEVTLVASLGYRSASADFIFGHVLVSHGLHFQEKRLFEHVGEYLDAINLLDPKFRDPYLFADTLLTVQPKSPPTTYYFKARDILARGVKELPYDQELWSSAGEFLAYIAPPHLKDETQRKEFKRLGTQYLVRACDLIGSDQNLPFHCITAANLLSKQGDREAARSFLERVLEMTNDAEHQEVHDQAQLKLQAISDTDAVERSKRREQRYQAVAIRDGMAFVSRVELDVVGPATDTTLCAGNQAEPDESCASSWRRFVEHQEQAEDENR